MSTRAFIAREPRMSVTGHLGELRNRLIKSLIAVVLAFGVAWMFVDKIVFVLELPLLKALPAEARHLYFTGLTDKFLVYFRAALMTALVATSPYWLAQIWLFVEPALSRRSGVTVFRFVFAISATFISGVAFSYFFCLPYGCKFLVAFGGGSELPLITLAGYFEFILRGLVAMGLVFELPILMQVLCALGMADAKQFARRRPIAFFASSVAAAVIAPSPDLFSMLATMLPLYLLYELGIIAARLTRG